MEELNSDSLLFEGDVPVEIIREQIRLSLMQSTPRVSRRWDFVSEDLIGYDSFFQGGSGTEPDRTIGLKPPQVQRVQDGLPSGYRDMDRILGGFHRGELITVSASPSSGTSTLLQNIARKVATRPAPAPTQKSSPSHSVVAYFSLDVPKKQIASRLISAEAKINPSILCSGLLRDPNYARLAQARDRLNDTRLMIIDQREITTEAISRACENLKRQSGLDLIVIDRADIIGIGGNGTCAPLGQIMSDLKNIAQALDVPIITACKIDQSRLDEKTLYRPRVQSVSSAVALYSDVVTTLYRPDNWIPNHFFAEDRDRALSGITQVQKGLEVLEFSVLHQVGGRPETARLAFNKDWCRVDNILWADS